MVKKLLSFVLLISFVATSSAVADGKKEDKKTGTEDTKKGKSEKKEENLKEADYTSVNSKSQADSSFHSISKYNFLFYMVYKVKYGDMDPVSDSKPIIAEE